MKMNILITGSNGFIGKNLFHYLSDFPEINILTYTRNDKKAELKEKISASELIVHLAGVNRPDNDSEFYEENAGLVSDICKFASDSNKKIPVIFSSSAQAINSTPYGASKKSAEEILEHYSKTTNSKVIIYRFPGIFGKWCKPEYNSVIATFCYNISHGLPVRIDNENTRLTLNYIDDVVFDIASYIQGNKEAQDLFSYQRVEPLYEITIKELINTLEGFRNNRKTLEIDRVGKGLKRALYATYISYLDESDFSYEITSHDDQRGRFVEFIKTADSGQVSYFTARPGESRGQHYHHSKTEKFLVVQGEACFRYRQLNTNKYYEIAVSADNPVVIESIPGWAHDVKNSGQKELIVLLWSSEVFDKERPDTIPQEI